MEIITIPDDDYPKLMYNPDNGRIVLFYERSKGTQLNTVTNSYGVVRKAGEYSERWVWSSFVPYNGIVVLSNGGVST